MVDRSLGSLIARSLEARKKKEQRKRKREEVARRRRKEEEEATRKEHNQQGLGGSKLWAGEQHLGKEQVQKHFGKTNGSDWKPKGSLLDCISLLLAMRLIGNGDCRQEA